MGDCYKPPRDVLLKGEQSCERGYEGAHAYCDHLHPVDFYRWNLWTEFSVHVGAAEDLVLRTRLLGTHSSRRWLHILILWQAYLAVIGSCIALAISLH